jgi:hypothetical protein
MCHWHLDRNLPHVVHGTNRDFELYLVELCGGADPRTRRIRSKLFLMERTILLAAHDEAVAAGLSTNVKLGRNSARVRVQSTSSGVGSLKIRLGCGIGATKKKRMAPSLM